MHINDFDYNLPEELIAQKPADKRENSRLLVVHRDTGELEHKHFYNIVEYLNPGDCLVLNNSKVLPARLFGTKSETGAKVEFLLIKRLEGDLWETMVRPGKRLKPGDVVDFSKGGEKAKFQATVIDYGEEGTRHVKFEYEGIFLERLEEIGSMPLPPYIERASQEEDKERYQTVYCMEEGSVAAPTAGLHFTKELLEKAAEKGVEIAYVTLHVGIGTFRPVKCEIIEEHKMHFEEYEVSSKSADIINKTKKSGGRVICVGTTSCRTIESAAVLNNIKNSENCVAVKKTDTNIEITEENDINIEIVGENDINDDATEKNDINNNESVEKDIIGNVAEEKPIRDEIKYKIEAGSGSTGIFIYPGYEFKLADCLITNFHLPKSTLLMLISALYDRESILKVYDEAVKEKYRFFSYGDAMLIL